MTAGIVKSLNVLFFIFAIELTLTSSFPNERVSDNEIDNDVIDLSRFGDKIFGDPSEDVGRMVDQWTPESGQNPEELGTYVEGDILIPFDEARNGLASVASRWRDGVVPYVLQSSVSATDRRIIKQAIDIYEKQTCIRFVPRTSEKDYISVESSNSGCWSSVGRIGGKQTVNLQSGGCTSKIGTVLHEFLHALGFYHEQNRPERDNFVRVLTQNIKPETLPNFQKAKPGETVDYGVQYDLGSVMHYSPTAFTKNGAKTIVPLSAGAESRMGQRESFSRGDLIKVRSMYRCDDGAFPGESSGPAIGNSGGGGSTSGGGGNGFNQAVGGFLYGLGSFFHGLGGGGRQDENDIDQSAEQLMGQRKSFSPSDLIKIKARYCPNDQTPDDRLPIDPEHGPPPPFYPEYGPPGPPYYPPPGPGPLYPEYGPGPNYPPPPGFFYPPPPPHRPGFFGFNRPIRPFRPILGK